MSCTYYKWNGGIFGDYWCTKNDCRVDSDTYYKYCRDYNYDECPIYKKSESSGCFITTVACQILGLDDKAPLLNNFRNFRDNILQKDKKYEETLKEYDVIGPKIACCLMHDNDRQEMAQGLYQNILLPVNELINQQEYDKAVEAYYIMTLSLVNYYGLKHEYNDAKDNNYGYKEFNQQTAGHGLKKVKTIRQQ